MQTQKLANRRTAHLGQQTGKLTHRQTERGSDGLTDGRTHTHTHRDKQTDMSIQAQRQFSTPGRVFRTTLSNRCD